MNINTFVESAVVTLTAVAWKVAGAFALWLVGRWLIAIGLRMLRNALARQVVDATLARYAQTSLSVLLNIVLVVAILGYFEVETPSFAALLAAGGVAFGVAWGGLLANVAAEAFLVFLRPFKVGDFVTAGGVTGTVDAIGLFGTTINTPDKVRTIVGPSCSNTHYWQVYFDANRAIREAFGEAGYPAPMPTYALRGTPGA